MIRLMKHVAKLVMIDPDNNYLLMYRSKHPIFGMDADLPGGTVETGEALLEAVLREVQEEVGVYVTANSVHKVYSGTDYSVYGTHYSMFISSLNARPEIKISWEHSSFEWLCLNDFLFKAKNAKDTYMHMVYDILNKNINTPNQQSAT